MQIRRQYSGTFRRSVEVLWLDGLEELNLELKTSLKAGRDFFA
jgi:hypothetical protein